MKLIALILLFVVSVPAAPVISRYTAEVRRESASQYRVTVSFEVSGGAWAHPSFTLGPFRSGGFQGCDACTAAPQGILQKLSLAPGASELTYRIAAAAGRDYIPLAVPEIHGSAAPQSVEIRVLPGTGVKLNGDMFPVLTADSADAWTAHLANIVNHVEFDSASAAPSLGPREWSDIAVVILLAGGLLTRAVIVRKARTA